MQANKEMALALSILLNNSEGIECLLVKLLCLFYWAHCSSTAVPVMDNGLCCAFNMPLQERGMSYILTLCEVLMGQEAFLLSR